MKLYWKIFWLTLGILLGLALIGGCAVSAHQKSLGMFYQTIQLVFTVGFGVCGFAALIVVPIELYLEDRKAEDSR
ncbi:MAG: hypothetical protein LBG73_08295 [Spirochaetaceae bacterium]|jgi:hypothetical protein|nr:hypothetical protein [Spirochaetaceae bacterium]